MTEACAGAFQKLPTPVDSTGTCGFSYRFVKYILQIISDYDKFLQILSNYLHISNIFCNFASSFGNEPEAITKKENQINNKKNENNNSTEEP